MWGQCYCTRRMAQGWRGTCKCWWWSAGLHASRCASSPTFPSATCTRQPPRDAPTGRVAGWRACNHPCAAAPMARRHSRHVSAFAWLFVAQRRRGSTTSRRWWRAQLPAQACASWTPRTNDMCILACACCYHSHSSARSRAAALHACARACHADVRPARRGGTRRRASYGTCSQNVTGCCVAFRRRCAWMCRRPRRTAALSRVVYTPSGACRRVCAHSE